MGITLFLTIIIMSLSVIYLFYGANKFSNEILVDTENKKNSALLKIKKEVSKKRKEKQNKIIKETVDEDYSGDYESYINFLRSYFFSYTLIGILGIVIAFFGLGVVHMCIMLSLGSIAILFGYFYLYRIRMVKQMYRKDI